MDSNLPRMTAASEPTFRVVDYVTERIAELEAQLAEARAEVERLRASAAMCANFAKGIQQAWESPEGDAQAAELAMLAIPDLEQASEWLADREKHWTDEVTSLRRLISHIENHPDPHGARLVQKCREQIATTDALLDAARKPSDPKEGETL